MLVILLFFLFLPGQVFAGKISGTVNVRGLRSPKNILVYLTKAPQTALGFSSTNFVMDRKNLTFNPHILPVPVGATVHFPNNDELNHNVFSLSRTKKFNLGSYKPGESKTVLFDTPGIVELRCDVHAEMLAYILVLKNPYFGITDENGRFEIPDSKYLNQVGIKTNLRFLQFQALRPMTRTAEAQFSHLSWGSLGINDISAITSWFFKFSSDDQDRNAQVKEWLEKGDTATDPAVRKENYKKALKEIAEQAYWVPLWSYVRFYGTSNDLDFEPHFDDIARFWLAKWK